MQHLTRIYPIICVLRMMWNCGNGVLGNKSMARIMYYCDNEFGWVSTRLPALTLMDRKRQSSWKRNFYVTVHFTQFLVTFLKYFCSRDLFSIHLLSWFYMCECDRPWANKATRNVLEMPCFFPKNVLQLYFPLDVHEPWLANMRENLF